MRVLSEGRVLRGVRALLPAAALALGFAGALTPQVAQAQFFNWGNDSGWGNDNGWGWGGWGRGEDRSGLGANQVYRVIGEHGFRVIAPLRRRGAVFIAEVVDRRGREERLIVSAADGQILQRFVITDQRQPRDARLQPGDELERQMDQGDRGSVAPPIPPASIPNAGNQERTDGYADPNAVETFHPRSAPKPVRPPKPRLVDRAPDAAQPDDVTAPPRFRPRPPRIPAPPPTVTASRPADPVSKPSAPPSISAAAPVGSASQPTAAVIPAAPPSTRMRDPLAIPREGTPAGVAKASTAPGTVEGVHKSVPAPAAAGQSPATPVAKAPAQTGDVPVAPLD